MPFSAGRFRLERGAQEGYRRLLWDLRAEMPLQALEEARQVPAPFNMRKNGCFHVQMSAQNGATTPLESQRHDIGVYVFAGAGTTRRTTPAAASQRAAARRRRRRTRGPT